MIHDKISNYKKYDLGSAWNKAFAFILSLDENSKEGKHYLDSKNVYAGINCYETKEYKQGKWEAHKKYVDIQLLLSGKELVKVASVDKNKISKEYDVEKDCMFFEGLSAGLEQIELGVGNFCVFFSDDAHMPQLMVGDKSEGVKKVVVKIDKNLLNSL